MNLQTPRFTLSSKKRHSNPCVWTSIRMLRRSIFLASLPWFAVFRTPGGFRNRNWKSLCPLIVHSLWFNRQSEQLRKLEFQKGKACSTPPSLWPLVKISKDNNFTESYSLAWGHLERSSTFYPLSGSFCCALHFCQRSGGCPHGKRRKGGKLLNIFQPSEANPNFEKPRS